MRDSGGLKPSKITGAMVAAENTLTLDESHGCVTRHTADGAVLLLHAVLPRSGIGPRGIDDTGFAPCSGPPGCR
jgi:hypothetical protein